ncbi:MLO-like protein 6 [Forsythia ovata]|uniref:MLO-like protein n=1 Tax=Forsythia ovata TaxID=205694 RepID=A0ABD1T495_9LAMI
MAGAGGGRTLEQTLTWAVAVVCFVLVTISIIIEYIIHLVAKWLKSKHKNALYEALEKIKSELMLLGFISLLLTVGQGPISDICIPAKVGATWHPCTKYQEVKKYKDVDIEVEHHRKLLEYGGARRVLAAASTDKCAAKGKVPFVSADGIHQLHIFIFVLAVFHVLYCILTLALGRAKMRRWKAWEKETQTVEYQFSHDPERFRFARETSFGRRHLSFWSKIPFLLWIVCFFRQFVRSVPKVDYMTLRHGFIMAHLAPQSHTKFDFQKYIKRSLEEDFKVVVGISPPIWLFAVLFLLFNTHGWYSYLWLPFLPLIIILLVGTKLQVIITKMGIRIQERGEVVKGVPVVEPGDDLFWFNRPRFILYLINFVLFQMGSTMKPTIFNDRVVTALRNWHHTAKKHVKQTKSGSVTPMSTRPTTPTHSTSPLHLLRNYKSKIEIDSLQIVPRKSNYDTDYSDIERSPSPTCFHQGGESSAYNHDIELGSRGRAPQQAGGAAALAF